MNILCELVFLSIGSNEIIGSTNDSHKNSSRGADFSRNEHKIEHMFRPQQLTGLIVARFADHFSSKFDQICTILQMNIATQLAANAEGNPLHERGRPGVWSIKMCTQFKYNLIN